MLRPELRRFGRFLMVGLSGTLVDLVVLSLLKHFLGWPTIIANILSYSVGILNNYLLNRLWVYPETKNQQSAVQLLQFCLISLIGLALNNLLVWLLEPLFGQFVGDYSYLPAKFVATAFVLIWNFGANRLWTFKPKQAGKLHANFSS